MVAISEFAAQKAAFVLHDVYENFRLWVLSPDAIRNIRALDLDEVLGNQYNADECLRMLTVIEDTRFQDYPAAWSNRGRVEDGNSSPGRTGPGADWVWYDPINRRLLTFTEAEVLEVRATRVRAPDDHPLGWDYSDFQHGSEMPAGGHVVRTGAAGENAYGWGGDCVDDDGVVNPVHYPLQYDEDGTMGAVETVAQAVHQSSAKCNGQAAAAGSSNAHTNEPAYLPTMEFHDSRDNNAIIHNFLFDAGMPVGSLRGMYYTEMRAYICGRLER